MKNAQPGAARQWLWIAAFVLVYGAVGMLVQNAYHQLIMVVVLVWAVMGLAWNLLSGYSGLISFGHAAFFGLGAYTVALGMLHWNLTPWLTIPLAAALGALAGIIVGIPTFRLRGHYFALAMLAYPLALLYVFEWLGYQEIALPMRREAPAAYMQFENRRVYILLALGLLLVSMAATRLVERSRFGMSLLAIKQDETAAEAAGVDTLAWKLRAITLSGAMAAAAGGFYAVVLLVVTPPAVFGMLVSAQALVVAMFGGVGTLWGPVIGAVTLVPLSEFLHGELAHIVPGIQGVIYGVAIIAVIVYAPDGVFWKVRDALARRRERLANGSGATGDDTPSAGQPGLAARSPAVGASVASGPSPFAIDATAAARPVLEAHNLSKSFGGLRAVSGVDLSVASGEILGIIGPNGAGKTTLFNLLNGFMPPDGGDVLLDGSSILGKKPNRICRLGVGRTFQVVKPFRRMSIAENVIVGAYVASATDEEARELAARAIEHVGLAGDAHLLAGGITNKQLRLMELARALASKPRILLLDEILAGLHPGEIEALIEVIRRLAGLGITVVIIEHTMRAMVRLVDRFVVLDHGALLAEGPPAAIIQDPKVIEAYLGKKWAEGATDA